MQPSRVLKKIKLYEPLKEMAGRLAAIKETHSEKLKRSYYRRVVRRGGDRTEYKPDVLVVLNCGGIGNGVEGTPVVQGLRALWPGAVITTVVPRGDLFEGWCVPDRITDCAEDVRGQRFDHSFFPYPFLSAISPWHDVCELGVVHHPRVWLRKYFLKPEREYFMDMLKPLGYKGPVLPLYASVKKPVCPPAGASMRICLVPGSNPEDKWRHKRWPHYGRLADEILSKYESTQVCIIGTRRDEFSATGLHEDRLIDLRDRLTLAETAWVLRNSNLVIGNDCGPMHIACAVQAKAIVIFGPTCPIKNAPWNKGVALVAPSECGPCQYDLRLEECPDACCMGEVGMDTVLDKISRLLPETI